MSQISSLRFLHTGDWQLGIRRHFFGAEAQAAFSQARLDAVDALGRTAREEDCELIVVCGDVFESNQLDRRTVAQSLEAMRHAEVDLYLLPGNHDPLDASSIFRGQMFEKSCPPNVHVLDRVGPWTIRPGVELVAAPFVAKRTPGDPLEPLYGVEKPAPGVVRVAVGHGGVDRVAGDAGSDGQDPIRLERAEAALAEGRFHYLALGDRHSLTQVGETGRIWYAGSPEPTDFTEKDPGNCLVVEATRDGAEVQPRSVGRWRFVDERRELSGEADVDALESWLAELPDKRTSVVRLALQGQVSLRDHARTEELLEHHQDLLGALVRWRRHWNLVPVPDDFDRQNLSLSGFAEVAFGRLLAAIERQQEDSVEARDALALLYRLARE